jgi:hypothetical protein
MLRILSKARRQKLIHRYNSMSTLDSAIPALAAAVNHTTAPDLRRAITAVVDAHKMNAPAQPDRTAIAAQLLAAVVANDPHTRASCAGMARVAINLTDALLRELAAPVAETVPDRAAAYQTDGPFFG